MTTPGTCHPGHTWAELLQGYKPVLFPLPPSVPPMTEAVARQALLRFVASRCCYGSRAVGELAIRRLRPLGTYRYRLETFSESRLSEWVFEPFTKPGAAGPSGDTPMDPWDVDIGAPPLFQGQTRRCRVPHSVLVRVSPRSLSATRCVTCKGSRRRLKQQKRCQLCSGTGRKRCNTCSGRGSKTCVTCQGEKKLQHFKQLVITWKNNVFEFVSEHHLNFPGELLSKVSGANIFKDENVVVYPIIDFPDPEISLASQRAITEHSTALATSSRILRQVRGSPEQSHPCAQRAANEAPLVSLVRHYKMLRIVTDFIFYLEVIFSK
uniref:Ssu-2 homolog n=1 Tax=Athene cunicularia TaxID=194338 RepID=A0A663M648_ATHCN